MVSNRMLRRIALPLLLVLLLLASGVPGAQAPVASAANGDPVHRTYFSRRCGSGIGVGIAFDGEYLWYSCYSSNPDLFKARALDGVVVAAYNVAGGLGALAWDGNRKRIWAGWGGGAGGSVVRLIDPATGAGTVVFSAAHVGSGIDDGLAYDAQDDTLYISGDVHRTIHHYSSTGAHLNDFHWSGSGCGNSGLAIGGELMYQGSNGCTTVYAVRRTDHSLVFSFSTIVPGDSNFRDEDLECDSVTFSPRTVMWSVEAYEPRRAVAFEVPPGTCATGGGVDSDGDGLLDDWEINGVTIDPDGAGPVPPQFIDLRAMGADKNKPDIFLHIDWMENAAHSHKLDPAAIRKVVEAFRDSPYVSPTGSVGINLHVDQGPASILDHATNTTWGALSQAGALTHVNNLGAMVGGSYDWSAFQAIKDAAGGFTDTGRTPIFHYVIAAHNYGGGTSSGISRGIGASDLIVSLGSFTGGVGSVNEQAGTLMHELGHNLNLRHGGDVNTNYKPNYLSVMSYAFQMGGVIKGGAAGTFDYSRSVLGSLNEASLNEPPGLGAAAAGYGTRHYCAGTGFVPVINAAGAIDWNCDGDTADGPISVDINNGGGAAQVLTGHDDWANLKLKGGAIGLAGVEPELEDLSEPDPYTPEVDAEILPLGEDCTPDPSLTWRAPLGGAPASIAVGDTLSIGFTWGSCSGFIHDESVMIVVRDLANPDYPVAAFMYGFDITIDEVYSQDFSPAWYWVSPGSTLAVEAYLNYELAGTAQVLVTP